MVQQIEPGAMVPVPFRFIAKAGFNNDWAMYMGWTEWSDEKIAAEGDKVFPETAKKIVQECVTVGRQELAGFRDLAWRHSTE